MSAKANHFKIGVFVVSAVLLIVAGIVIFGAGRIFERTVMMESYFDESVQGLAVGAPVKHRGVQVGVVMDIHFADDEYDLPANDEKVFRFRRYVVVKSKIHDQFPGFSQGDIQALLAQASERGLRVRLASQGVTGVVHIEADYVDPKEFPPLPIVWTPHNLYVPSAPSTTTVIGSALGNIARDLEQANVHEITKDIDTLVKTITKMANEAEVKQVSQDTHEALAEVKGTLQQARALLENPKIAEAISDAAVAAGGARVAVADLAATTKQVRQVSQGLPETVARLDKAVRRVDKLVANRSADLDEVLENLRIVSENLRDLTASVKQYPAQALLGDPPPHVEPGKR